MQILSHRIQRLRWQVSTDTTDQAFVVRQHLFDRWQDTLLPAFEAAFDAGVGDDRVIHISKLELHLQVGSVDELLEKLPELIHKELHQQLQSIPVAEPISESSSRLSVQTQTTEQSQFATLLHYLKTGHLPWQTVQTDVDAVKIELQQICDSTRSQLFNHLCDQPEDTPFYFRLLQLQRSHEVNTLLAALADRLLPIVGVAIVDLLKTILGEARNQLSCKVQAEIIAAILSEGWDRVSQLPSSLQQTLPGSNTLLLPQAHTSLAMTVDNILAQAGIDRQTFVGTLPNSAANLFLPSSDGIGSHSTSLTEPLDAIMPDRLSDKSSVEGQSDRESIGIFGDNSTDSNAEQIFPFFVNDAGLVLLHPFIGSLFEATGIKMSGCPTIEAAQIPRAAALLHFLATGRLEIYEYELGLVKVFLGLDLDTPLLIEQNLLQEADRHEAEILLQSVINYWTVLKNTSIEGIRSSFLQRSGLLRPANDGWSLQVEHQSFDMLLEHLPWSLSIIKLSWMQFPLYTEWLAF